MKFFFYVVFIHLLIINFTRAQHGTIVGAVLDANNSESLIGATIVIENTTKGTITDFDGNYNLQNVETGTYNILCSYISYQTQKVENVTVVNGEEIRLNFELTEAVTELNEVQVVARVSRESEALMLLDQKKATSVKESIGASRLSELGVSDASSATTKITGVTKTEGTGDVYVRGLGDRYLITTMNGLPIPSDDIDKKNISLGLFSTDVISSVGINKTYEASNYGDQSSGNVNIESKRLAKNNSIGISSGINSYIISEDVFGSFRATQNMDDITLGFYNQPYTTIDAVQKQSWNTRSRSLPLNYGASAILGKSMDLKNERKLHLFGTISHSGESEYRKGVYRKYRSNTDDKLFSDAIDYITTIRTTGLLNVSYEISSGNSISFNSLFVNKTTDELYEAGRNLEGFIFEQIPKETEAFVRDQNIKETSLFINQLLGEHTLNDKNTIKWAVSYNRVNANEPNRIRNELAIYPNFSEFATTGGFQQRKSNQFIDDKEVNGYLQDEYTILSEEKRELKLNTGINFRRKTRDFSAQKISVNIIGDNTEIGSIDNVDEILINNTLYQDNSLRINDNLPTDLYSSELNVIAGFVNAVFALENISGNLGVRYEMDDMNVSWDVSNFVGRKGDVEPTYKNIFPALNLKYQISDNNAFRLALSKTTTIPEFKEMAPFEYVDPTGDVFKGNPDLKNSINYNADLKWELFPSTKELISLATFYKKIKDPINLALTRGSSGFFKYENTGNEANVYGVEFEVRYGVIKAKETGNPSLNLVLNTTKMWFNQDLFENFQYNNKTESGLEGASDFIANASLSFSTNSEKALTTTISGNYSSDKIFALGAPEDLANQDRFFNDEIIEKGFVSLDAVVSKKLSDNITLKLRGMNLLNPDIKRTQHIERLNSPEEFDAIVRSYKRGARFTINLKVDIN